MSLNIPDQRRTERCTFLLACFGANIAGVVDLVAINLSDVPVEDIYMCVPEHLASVTSRHCEEAKWQLGLS